MASHLGISRKSKHTELRRLWIQGFLSEGAISLERWELITIHQDVLTKFVQAAVLGQHRPKLNLFKDSHLFQVHKYCSVVEKLNAVKYVKADQACRAHAVLSKVYQQVCGQRQGQRFFCKLTWFTSGST